MYLSSIKYFKRRLSISMSDIITYWEPFFDLLGNEVRARIMFTLYGGELLSQEPTRIKQERPVCLQASELATITGIKLSTLRYHLSVLEKGDLIMRIPAMKNGRAVLLWKVTKKWEKMATELNLNIVGEKYLREKDMQTPA